MHCELGKMKRPLSRCIAVGVAGALMGGLTGTLLFPMAIQLVELTPFLSVSRLHSYGQFGYLLVASAFVDGLLGATLGSLEFVGYSFWLLVALPAVCLLDYSIHHTLGQLTSVETARACCLMWMALVGVAFRTPRLRDNVCDFFGV